MWGQGNGKLKGLVGAIMSTRLGASYTATMESRYGIGTFLKGAAGEGGAGE